MVDTVQRSQGPAATFLPPAITPPIAKGPANTAWADRFEGVTTTATPPPPKGPWQILKEAANSREGHIAGGCAVAAVVFATLPGAGDVELAMQVSGMFASSLGASVFGRVAIEDAAGSND